jgi:hypothetical protein
LSAKARERPASPPPAMTMRDRFMLAAAPISVLLKPARRGS